MTELDSLIEKRRAQIDAEKAKEAEAQRREREEAQRYHVDLQNFGLGVINVVASIVTMKGIKLRGVGQLVYDVPKPDQVRIVFVPEGTRASQGQTMTLSLDRAGNVSWDSAFFPPGKARLGEITHPQIDRLVDDFLTGALR